MAIQSGPILHFRGLHGKQWCTSALVITTGGDNPPIFLLHRSTVVPGVLLKKVVCRYTLDSARKMQQLDKEQVYDVWRFDWSVTQTEAEQEVVYTLNNKDYRYVVPGKGAELRIAYGSCFGYSHRRDEKNAKDRNAIWKKLLSQHKQPKAAYHLLFMGGDQIYADKVWKAVNPLKKWLRLSDKDRNKESFNSADEVRAFYFQLYLENFSRKEPAEAMQQIPTLMMWDDHDIVNGWGSHSDEQQNSEVYRSIFRIARECFCLFQLQSVKGFETPGLLLLQNNQALLDDQKGNLTFAHTIGDIALLALDLRTQRKRSVVMENEAWDAVWRWLKQHAKNCRHLLVFSSIPVAYLNIRLLEDFFQWLPGEQSYENGFFDRWGSRQHSEERLAMVQQLLQFSEETNCRVSFVSGDVHSAMNGYIEVGPGIAPGKVGRMEQFVSSAVVNVPPAKPILFILENVFGSKEDKLTNQLTARMEKFEGTNKRILANRNFLSLSVRNDKTLWAGWFFENNKSCTKVVTPCE